ncbi:MAG: radical SAM protein [Blastocatellia bacterium]|nr:radical SAM protein [Blastocatellia bacterium]
MDYNFELIKRYGRVLLGAATPPVILNILITSVCDMRCTHCFFTEELDDKDRKKLQMTTAQLARISETLGGKLPILIIAGGEPFTRKDLPEVVNAFYRNNQLESVYLMSNGGIQQRIIPDVKRILEECPRLNVTVALGIDGLKEDHEKIRRKPGSWERAIGTARQLQEIKREIPRLDIQTCTCFMNSNQDRIFEWYGFLRDELKPDKINVNYIRPPSADAKELEIDIGRYRKLAAMIDEDSRQGVIKNHYQGKGGYFKAAVDIYMHELIARTELEQKALLRCFAGTTGGVIYDEGTVSSCENLDPIGNLRDYDWDFRALWNSPELAARRRQIKQGCFCTHESNCYYPSLPFNPGHLIQIKKIERELKKSHVAEGEGTLEPRPA